MLSFGYISNLVISHTNRLKPFQKEINSVLHMKPVTAWTALNGNQNLFYSAYKYSTKCLILLFHA